MTSEYTIVIIPQNNVLNMLFCMGCSKKVDCFFLFFGGVFLLDVDGCIPFIMIKISTFEKLNVKPAIHSKFGKISCNCFKQIFKIVYFIFN